MAHNIDRADAYAQELCVDAMHDGTLKGNLAAAYLALKQALADCKRELRYEGDWAEQSIAEVARMKDDVMRAQRERDHWRVQYEALRQENLDLWTELEMARRIIRESGTTYPYKAKAFGGDTHWYNTAKPSEGK